MSAPSPITYPLSPSSHPDPLTLLIPIVRDALRPDPDISVDEWADQHRYLTSEASSEPGRWRTSRFPYLREPMRCMSPRSAYRLVALRFASQTGKTEAEINAGLCYVDIAPGPMLWLMPDERVMRRVAEQRIDPAIRACPERFAGRLHVGGGRKGGNTILSRTFPGGNLDMGTAGSASFLASKPVRYLLMDEVDRFKRSAGPEGRPIALAIKRTENFPNAKILITSTPTVEGESEIDDVISDTDDRRYLVPCPHCGFFQELVFSAEMAGGGVKPHGRIVWENDDPETALYECGNPDCKQLIDESHKAAMLAAGRWQASRTALNPTAVGFSLNGLYTPPGFTQTWKEVVRKFLDARKQPLKLQVFVNTVLAQSWRQKGQAPDYERLYERAEDYPIGVVPNGPLVLTAGVDVQKNRIEWEVYGWNENQRWSIDIDVIHGDPFEDAPWLELEQQLINRRYPHVDGGELPVYRIAIDTGYAAHEVYNFVRRQRQDQVICIKGVEGKNTIVSKPTLVDFRRNGQTLKSGARLHLVDVSQLKHELYAHLRRSAPDVGEEYPAGYCHFPRYPKDYFEQITAEGFVDGKWIKIRERNEHLDCSIYARAALLHAHGDRWKPDDWQRLRDELALFQTGQLTAPRQPAPRPRRGIRYKT